jgi:hypothetical protein
MELKNKRATKAEEKNGHALQEWKVGRDEQDSIPKLPEGTGSH